LKGREEGRKKVQKRRESDIISTYFTGSKGRGKGGGRRIREGGKRLLALSYHFLP